MLETLFQKHIGKFCPNNVGILHKVPGTTKYCNQWRGCDSRVLQTGMPFSHISMSAVAQSGDTWQGSSCGIKCFLWGSRQSCARQCSPGV